MVDALRNRVLLKQSFSESWSGDSVTRGHEVRVVVRWAWGQTSWSRGTQLHREHEVRPRGHGELNPRTTTREHEAHE